jgi:hypothetical protein
MKKYFLAKKNIGKIVVICLITLLVCIPFLNFFKEGPYLNFLSKEEVYEGFIELLFLGGFIYSSISNRFTNYRLIIQIFTITLLFLSLRRHNVDIPLIVIFLYFNFFFFLGSFFKKDGFSTSTLIAFSIAVGMILFSLFSLSLSVFNFAKDYVLLFTAFLFSFISFFIKGRNIISCLKWSNIKAVIKSYPLFFSLFVVLFLMLVFQTNNAPGYDEFWYSLRSHEILNRNGSFFEKIIYPDNWVAYYPKLADILIYPLLLIPNYVFSKLFSVATWGLISLLIFSFLMNGKDRKNSIMLTLIIVSTPVLGNSAIFTKGDILSLFFFITAFLFMIKSFENYMISYFLIAISISLVAVAARLSALPFTIIFILFFTITILISGKKNSFNFKIIPGEWVLITTSILLVFFIFFRTYYLVGVPIVQVEGSLPLIKLIYNFLGFHYNYCLQPLNMNMGAKIPFYLIMFSSFLQPMNLRAAVSWYSNFYVLLLIITFSYFFLKMKSNWRNIEIIFMTALVVVFWISTGVMMANEFYRGGDGNYYLIPVILTSMILAGFWVKYRIDKWLITIGFSLYFLLHFSLTFLVGPNWDPGTDAFHYDFTRNPLIGLSNKRIYKYEAISKLEIEDIIEYLPNEKKTCLAGIGDEFLFYKLGYSYLNLRNVEVYRGYLFEDYQSFLKLIESSNINFLIMSPNYQGNLMYRIYFDKIKDEPGVVEYRGKRYSILDLSKLF